MSEWDTEQSGEWGNRADTLLVVDEVVSEHEDVIPDMMILSKGLSERYLPLAITVMSEKLFSAFNGSVAESKALAYGLSHTGNALAFSNASAKNAEEVTT